MPLPTISDVYRVALEWDSGGALLYGATNVMHFRGAGITESDVYNALNTNVTANMWAHSSSNSKILTVVVQKLDGSSAAVPFSTGGPAKWAGTRSGSEIIPQVSALVKFTTAKRGRQYRGRAFLPWPVESQVAAGLMDSTCRSTMDTAWAAWLTAMHGGAVEPVIASYSLATAEAITTTLVELPTATQRRRLRR